MSCLSPVALQHAASVQITRTPREPANTLHSSQPISFRGHFVGVLLQRKSDSLVLAQHSAVKSLKGRVFADPVEAIRAVRQAMIAGRRPAENA